MRRNKKHGRDVRRQASEKKRKRGGGGGDVLLKPLWDA